MMQVSAVYCAGSRHYLFCMSEGWSCEEELSRQSVASTAVYASTKQTAYQSAQ